MPIVRVLIAFGFIMGSRLYCAEYISYIMVIAGHNTQQRLIQVHSATTIWDVKKKLEQEQGYPASFQKLHAIKEVSHSTEETKNYSRSLLNESLVKACMLRYNTVRFKLTLYMPPLNYAYNSAPYAVIKIKHNTF